MKISFRDAKPQHTRAAVGGIDTENRTAIVTWSTGADVPRSDWDGSYIERLSLDPKCVRLDRLNNGAPFLANHDGGDVAAVLGVVARAWIEGGKGKAKIRFAAEGVDPAADQVFRKIADGIVQNVSVGYRIHEAEKVGDVDGTPILCATDWEPFEISAVAIGADAGAGFRNFRSTNPRSNMEPTPEVKSPDVNLLAREEHERVTGIRAAVRVAKLGDDVATRLIASGTNLKDARGVVLDIMATRTEEGEGHSESIDMYNGHGITGGITEGERFARGAVSGILARACPGLVKQAKAAGVPEFADVDETPGDFRNMSLLDLARRSLEMQGVKTWALNKTSLVGRAFTTRSGPYAGTADFPVLLENVMNKMLLAAYAVTPDVWSRVCKVDTVPDFRPAPRYHTGSFGALDSLNENGEFKNKGIPDGAKFSIQTATKGNIIGISRALIINDDMGALADLGAKLGRAAKLSIEADFFNLILANGGLGPTMSDTNPFFYAGRGNIGTSAALTVAGLDADRVALGSQKDISGNEFLDLRPYVLLLPLSLEGQAKVLNRSATDPDMLNKVQVPNKVVGLFNEVAGTARLTGTRRYIFADPAVAPAFVVAFLEGQGPGPYLQSDLGWRVDGTELKVRTDYMVQAFDTRGAITNAGV
jgi:hypothetical protein